MKRLSALLALTALLPISVAAQDGPPPPPGAAPLPPPPDDWPGGPHAQEWHEKLDAFHLRLRARVLSVLTPAQRTLLAQIVGSLAVAAVPDVHGAVARLDATLETAQKQTILHAVQAGLVELHGMLPPHPAFSPGADELRRTQVFMRHPERLDAGEELLSLAVQFGKMHDVLWMRHADPGHGAASDTR
jgi:hypothetical protein